MSCDEDFDDLGADNNDKYWRYTVVVHRQMWLVIITVGAQASQDPD